MAHTSVPLPLADERVRCATFARAAGVDPVGTAIRADLLLAVEVPLPWPKPIVALPMLDGVRQAMDDAPVPTRVLAAVPADAERRSIIGYRRRPDGGVDRQSWRVDGDATADVVAGSVAELVAGRRPAAAEELAAEGDARPELWVCTQGSHDVCCGSLGSQLVLELEKTDLDLLVRRVSHTGGHRFAPTAISLPDGRMWADLDLSVIEQVLGQTMAPAELAPRCRGWWGAESGPAQAAERAAWSVAGWGWRCRSIELEQVDDERWQASVTGVVGGDSLDETLRLEVEIESGREIPTIACGEPGGLPAKPGREWQVITCEIVAAGR